MKRIILLLLVCLLAPIYISAARLKVYLREKNPNKNRELVMVPEVWYETESYEIDVYMHSAGVLTVYYSDGETVQSVNHLSFDLNKVFCEKDCNLIILETADGIVYEGYLKEEMK